MARDSHPAIRTQYDERYSDIERIEVVGSDTTFHRGFGETGTRVELVDASAIGGCPRCGEHEMVLSRRLNPEEHDDAMFFCSNIKCPHFVGDAVEYDMDKIRARQPHVWDNTARCPDCDTRHTIEMHRHEAHSYEYAKGNADDGGVVWDLCDQCLGRTDSEVEA